MKGVHLMILLAPLIACGQPDSSSADRGLSRETVLAYPGATRQMLPHLRRLGGQLRYCARGAEGRLVLRFNVNEERTKAVSVVENTIGDDTMARCAVRKVSRWQLDGVVDGTVEQAFEFQPIGG